MIGLLHVVLVVTSALPASASSYSHVGATPRTTHGRVSAVFGADPERRARPHRACETRPQHQFRLARFQARPSPPKRARAAPDAEPTPAESLAEEIRLPRPNPGPEPWPAAPSRTVQVALLIASVLWIVGMSWRVWRGSRAPATQPSSSPVAVARAHPTPLAAWADAVREQLVARYGPSWGAKTTEELATQPELPVDFTPEQAAQIIAFLRAADRVKFAEAADEDHQRETWEGWVTGFLASADAGATSRISGK